MINMIVALFKQLILIGGVFLVLYIYHTKHHPTPTIHDFVVFKDEYFKIERTADPERDTCSMKEVLNEHIKRLKRRSTTT